MLQPELLGVLGSRALRSRGLTARFLYAQPSSLVGGRDPNPPPVQDSVLETYSRVIRARTCALASDPVRTVWLSEEAHARLVVASADLERSLAPGGELGHIADWGGKLMGAAVRIAGLLHVFDSEEPVWNMVEVDVLERALSIAGYFRQQAVDAYRAMGVVGTLSDAAYVAGRLRHVGKPLVTRRGIHSCVSRTRFPTADTLNEVISRLEDIGFLVPVLVGQRGRGRPTGPTWRVCADVRVT